MYITVANNTRPNIYLSIVLPSSGHAILSGKKSKREEEPQKERGSIKPNECVCVPLSYFRPRQGFLRIDLSECCCCSRARTPLNKSRRGGPLLTRVRISPILFVPFCSYSFSPSRLTSLVVLGFL